MKPTAHSLTVLCALAVLPAHAWEPGDPIPEAIASIEAPFDMPQLRRPVFPDATYDIRDFGARACAWDAAERVLCTDAIRDAIHACHEKGGGTVLIPQGEWITGAVHLKSKVNLHVAEGAVLHFSDDREHYLPVVHVRHEGVEAYNYSPLVYAPHCEDVALTGRGTLEGHGDAWWAWHKLPGHATDRTTASGQPLDRRQYGKGAGKEGMRPCMIVPWKSKNVLIEGVTLKDPPMWTVQPVYSENVIIRGITILSRRGHNGDGIDVDSCKNVLIEYNDIQSNDDAVCLKSGMNQDGLAIGIPTENLVIRNFVARDVITGSGGIVFGSETSGGIRNVYVHDALFDSCDRGIRFKSTRGRGGVIENVIIEDVIMKDIRRESFNVNTSYSGGTDGPAPRFRNIRIRDIRGENVQTAINLVGLPDMNLEDIHLTDSSFTGAEEGATVSAATGVLFSNVTIQCQGRPLLLDNVSQSEFVDLNLAGQTPHVQINGSRDTLTLRSIKEAPADQPHTDLILKK